MSSDAAAHTAGLQNPLPNDTVDSVPHQQEAPGDISLDDSAANTTQDTAFHSMPDTFTDDNGTAIPASEPTPPPTMPVPHPAEEPTTEPVSDAVIAETTAPPNLDPQVVPLPQPRFFGQDVNYRDSFASSLAPTAPTPGLPRTPSAQGSLVPIAGADAGAANLSPKAEAGSLHSQNEKVTGGEGDGERDGGGEEPSNRKRLIILGALAGLIVLVLVIVLPVTLRKKHSSSSSSGGGTSGGSGSASPSGGSGSNSGSTGSVIVGVDGTSVTTEDGSTFTYSNKFGGYFIVDAANPFNDGAKAQSWSPALNETFKYGVDKIRGVNIGGWLNTEPFISPALYEKYPDAIDEWTLSVAMKADTSSGGGIQQLEQHYKTFITEQDFAQIAGAGLNHVRIPLAFWAIETMGSEPFLEGVSWKYFLKAIEWARKYGIRINLDLHAVPGSQNGYNHSGQRGPINFLNGVMGIANAQRTLDHLRILTEFISQPQYANVVTMLTVLNEPGQKTIGDDSMSAFYLQVHNMVRDITGRGEGKGAWIVIGNGFSPLSGWADYMPGADRLAIDWHPYFSFVDQDHSPLSSQVAKPCRAWGTNQNNSMDAFGMTLAGEWSNGFNDCGWYLNGAGSGSRWEGTLASAGGGGCGDGCCDEWDQWEKWDQDRKDDLREFALSTMDALQDWFFWTWKIGPSPHNKNAVRAPLWSYQLGLQNGWMPLDPRESVGKCKSHGENDPWEGPLKPTQTGGAGAGTIAPSFTRQYGDWPPNVIAGVGGPASNLPTYTPTGTLVTLAVPTFTPTAASAGGPVVTPTADPGNGWYDKDDLSKAYVPVAGCKYPNAWDAVDAAVPDGPCTGNAKRSYRYPIEARATGVPL